MAEQEPIASEEDPVIGWDIFVSAGTSLSVKAKTLEEAEGAALARFRDLMLAGDLDEEVEDDTEIRQSDYGHGDYGTFDIDLARDESQ